MRSRLPVVTAVLVSLTACSVVTGSGQQAAETRDVPPFSAVDLSGVGAVTVTIGRRPELRVEADDNLLPALTSSVVGSTLELGTRSGVTLRPKTPIRYQVTATQLAAVGVSGSGSVQAVDLDLDRIEVAISGSGEVRLAGIAAEQRVVVSGSGRFDGSALSASRVDVDVSGSGNVAVAATEELWVSISGSGTVSYSGSPQIQQTISGSGRLVKK